MSFLKSFPVNNKFVILLDQVTISKMIHSEFSKSSELDDETIDNIKKKVFNDYKKNNKFVDVSLLTTEINEICGNITDGIVKMEECITQADKTMKELKQNIEKEQNQENVINYFDKTLETIKKTIKGVQNSSIANALLEYYICVMMSNMLETAAAEAVSADKNPFFVSEKVIDTWNMKVSDVSLYFYSSLNNLYSHFTMTRVEGMSALVAAQSTHLFVAPISKIAQQTNKLDCVKNIGVYAMLEKMIKEVNKYKPFKGIGSPDLSEHLKAQAKKFNQNNCTGDITELSKQVDVQKKTIPEFFDGHDSPLNKETQPNKTTTNRVQSTSSIMPIFDNPESDNTYDYFDRPNEETTTQHHDINNEEEEPQENNNNVADNSGFAKIIMSVATSFLGTATVGAATAICAVLVAEKLKKKSIYQMLFCKKEQDITENHQLQEEARRMIDNPDTITRV